MKRDDAPAPPPPPPRNARTRRHSAKVVAIARQMYGDGDAWTPGEIARYLTRRGHPVSENTVRRWVVPGWERRHNLNRARAAQRRRDAEAPQVPDVPLVPAPALSDDELDQQMLGLRRRGLAYSAIAQVVDIYHDVALEADQVRWRLRRLGVKPQPGKSAAMRRKWAEQKASDRSSAAA